MEQQLAEEEDELRQIEKEKRAAEVNQQTPHPFANQSEQPTAPNSGDKSPDPLTHEQTSGPGSTDFQSLNEN